MEEGWGVFWGSLNRSVQLNTRPATYQSMRQSGLLSEVTHFSLAIPAPIVRATGLSVGRVQA